MKIRSSIKKICNNCSIIRRSAKLFNLCKFNNHKQRQK